MVVHVPIVLHVVIAFEALPFAFPHKKRRLPEGNLLSGVIQSLFFDDFDCFCTAFV